MWDPLRAPRQAVGGVRTLLKALYDSLSDEQKARINALSDATVVRRGGNVFEPQACAESASKSPAWPAKPTEEAVRPTDQQRASLGALASTTSHLSALLQPSCPTGMLVTPTGRLEAVVNRLDSMIYAVTLERAALNKFYASLNDDQKAGSTRRSVDHGPDLGIRLFPPPIGNCGGRCRPLAVPWQSDRAAGEFHRQEGGGTAAGTP